MSAFYFPGLSSPYLLFLWLAGVISFSWCLLWGQELFWCFLCFSSGRWVTGQALPHSCLVLPSAWPGDRLGQRNCRDKISGCMGNVGLSHMGSEVWQIRVAAVATASSSKADGSVGSRLRMTQLALLTPAQVWMKPRLTPEVCSEFILLMHTAGRCLILSPAAVLAGVKIATLCSELSMGEGVFQSSLWKGASKE